MRVPPADVPADIIAAEEGAVEPAAVSFSMVIARRGTREEAPVADVVEEPTVVAGVVPSVNDEYTLSRQNSCAAMSSRLGRSMGSALKMRRMRCFPLSLIGQLSGKEYEFARMRLYVLLTSAVSNGGWPMSKV